MSAMKSSYHSYISDGARVFAALLHRDLIVMRQRLRGLFLDGVAIAVTELIIFGLLFPLFGMPEEFAAALCVGALISLTFLFVIHMPLKKRMNCSMAASLIII